MTLVARVRLSTRDVSYSGSNMVVLLLSGLSLAALYALAAGPLCVHLSALCCRTFDSRLSKQHRKVAVSRETGQLPESTFRTRPREARRKFFKLLILGWMCRK